MRCALCCSLALPSLSNTCSTAAQTWCPRSGAGYALVLRGRRVAGEELEWLPDRQEAGSYGASAPGVRGSCATRHGSENVCIRQAVMEQSSGARTVGISKPSSHSCMDLSGEIDAGLVVVICRCQGVP